MEPAWFFNRDSLAVKRNPLPEDLPYVWGYIYHQQYKGYKRDLIMRDNEYFDVLQDYISQPFEKRDKTVLGEIDEKSVEK